MTFSDALVYAMGTSACPIHRTTQDGYEMRGYLDGSVDVCRKGKVVKKLAAGTGVALGDTDWQPEGER